MTDVIKIAKERRVRLAAELGKLDDFIRMAEALVDWSQSNAGKAGETGGEIASDSGDSSTVHSYSAAASAAAKKQ